MIPTLDQEVREHDPLLALDGGPDGLEPYRDPSREAGRLPCPGGLLVVEIGYDQAEALTSLAGVPALKSYGSPTIYREPALRRHEAIVMNGMGFLVPGRDKV